MNLSKEEIKFIDDFLIRNRVKFVDVRLELVDHLATEFQEESNYSLLEDYLNSKLFFIRDFVRKRQKSFHWSYQKQLWKRLSYFFYKPTYFLTAVLLLVIVSFLTLNYGEKGGGWIFIILIVLSQLGAIYVYIKSNKSLKKVQSAQPLLSVMSLPSLFLYSFAYIKEYLLENQAVFVSYVFVAILFNISGFIELLNIKREVIQKYQLLIK
jgi:cation transport ATPase